MGTTIFLGPTCVVFAVDVTSYSTWPRMKSSTDSPLRTHSPVVVKLIECDFAAPAPGSETPESLLTRSTSERLLRARLRSAESSESESRQVGRFSAVFSGGWPSCSSFGACQEFKAQALSSSAVVGASFDGCPPPLAKSVVRLSPQELGWPGTIQLQTSSLMRRLSPLSRGLVPAGGGVGSFRSTTS